MTAVERASIYFLPIALILVEVVTLVAGGPATRDQAAVPNQVS